MTSTSTILLKLTLATWCAAIAVSSARGYEREDYEEESAASFQVVLNPDDGVYGVSFGAGTWLRGTPVFGDYFLGLFQSDIEDAWYSNVGMTIRVMPHWRVAPFIGAGGSYNYSWSGEVNASSEPQPAPLGLTEEELAQLPDRGESYWGGHVEAGIRLHLPEPLYLFEAMGRYTWVSLDGDREYWLVGISTGTGF